ncbi:hypothetical protein NC653_010326 [Populus alba x Populus x berolinensis]|uniref:Uncharacterized protein n=1 Tax=Populus alba x Populus x berolinensis TaxID=444605 RepID=A0AAD6W551_9ROSI|nr:hypothetical protein NC653_010326 [Populus alba x Populus x berolinensis]
MTSPSLIRQFDRRTSVLQPPLKNMMCSSSLLPEHIIIHLNGAQFAFFLPTGTPSNIVGFTIEIKDMIKTGVPLEIAGIAALSFLLSTLGFFFYYLNSSRNANMDVIAGAYVFGTNEEVR